MAKMKILQSLAVISGMLLILLAGGCLDQRDGRDTVVGALFGSNPPAAPAAPTVMQNGDALAVNWQPVENAAYYLVYVAVNIPEQQLRLDRPISGTAVVIDHFGILRSGDRYYIRISAISNAGVESPQSPSTMITIP